MNAHSLLSIVAYYPDKFSTDTTADSSISRWLSASFADSLIGHLTWSDEEPRNTIPMALPQPFPPESPQFKISHWRKLCLSREGSFPSGLTGGRRGSKGSTLGNFTRKTH